MSDDAAAQTQQEQIYGRWLKCTVEDPEMQAQLRQMELDSASRQDSFCCDLVFGTGGMRGKMGAGPNRINPYTIARATQALVSCLQKKRPSGIRIAVCFDSRRHSELFARRACEVITGNGGRAYLFPEMMPTPCLSYAVRRLHCSGGIMITASHNPAQYNGYKVYEENGCQITLQAAAEIMRQMKTIDVFNDVKSLPYPQGLAAGSVRFVPKWVSDDFILAAKEAAEKDAGSQLRRDISIVYSPLNGTGRRPVQQVLRDAGFRSVAIVPEQEFPDPEFSTCKRPNPEDLSAFELALRYARKTDADIVFTTDPDCDRVGVAVKNGQNQFAVVNGNDLCLLLLEFVCSQRLVSGRMPDHPAAVKTIVTNKSIEALAAHYGVEVISVLPGFKYIGEQIDLLEADGRLDSFLLGLEDSCGYLCGPFVRDKDGVSTILLMCEMYCFYKDRGHSLFDELETLHRRYGYRISSLYPIEYAGSGVADRTARIMASLRKDPVRFPDADVAVADYRDGIRGLPPADIIEYTVNTHDSVIIRPSGTESRLKVYYSISGATPEQCAAKEKRFREIVSSRIRKADGNA